jgi:hypothetical protein
MRHDLQQRGWLMYAARSLTDDKHICGKDQREDQFSCEMDDCFADLACKQIVICETHHILITQIKLFSISIHFLPRANHAKSSVDFRVRTCGIARGAIDCVFCAGSYDWECHRNQEQS